MALDIRELRDQPIESVSAIVLTEEVLSETTFQVLSGLFEEEPVWSELPIVAFAGRNHRQPTSLNQALTTRVGPGRNIVILKRPVRVSSFIRDAVRRPGTTRQHELRDQLVAREKVEAHAHMLASEMKHRVKNTLTMVGAVASQTFRTRNRWIKRSRRFPPACRRWPGLNTC